LEKHPLMKVQDALRLASWTTLLAALTQLEHEAGSRPFPPPSHF